jgi:hypothetical protein
MKQTAEFQLHRDAFGKLVMTTADGAVYVGVVPVRAFPITAPDQGIALVSIDGHEMAWFPSMQAVPDDVSPLVREELASREFMPGILRILKVSSFATPCTWTVDTDRGETSFTLKGEDDIRRLAAASLLITDSHGIQFLIHDVSAMDRASRKILDRFL